MTSSEVEWPTHEAKNALLFVPDAYDPYQNKDSPRKCFFRFDTEHKMLVLEAEDTDEVLDTIDPNDVIGANVEVELLGDSACEPRVPSSTFRNGQVTDGPSSPVDGGIFQPIGDDNENIFKLIGAKGDRRAPNEPSSPIPFDSQAVAMLTIFVYPRKDPSKESIVTTCTGRNNHQPVKEFPQKQSEGAAKKVNTTLLHRYPHHRKFQVAPAEDFAMISSVVKAIRQLARPNSPTTGERLLVMVNPFSGRKKGMEIYSTIIAPMLDQAGIDHDPLITTHAGHCEERMAKQDGSKGPDGNIMDISEYSGLVAVGGDGTIYEVMQGIKKRPDCDDVLKKLTIGHIGAGTSNGLSASLAHACQEDKTPTDYTFIIAKGNKVKMDLSRYETKSENYLSFLTFSWSIIADIDIESEVLRWLGWLRMDVYAVWRVLNLRSYRAKLSYLPKSANTIDMLPPLADPLPEEKGWVTIEDDFCLFWVSQVTHAGEAMLNHPQSKPDDGLFHIFLVRNTVSRVRMALILLALEHGGHVDMDHVEFIECTAYRLEPITLGSFNDLDGEVIESGPIQGMVLPGAIQAYCNL